MSRLALALLVVSCALLLASSNAPSLPSFEWSHGVYQQWVEPEVLPEPPQTIRFVGDIMLGRAVEELSTQYGADYPFRHLPLAATNTLVVGNLEGVIPRVHQPTPLFGYAFSFPVRTVAALQAVPFDYLSLANNHSYDFGVADYFHTRMLLASSSITAVGDRDINQERSIDFIPTPHGEVALIALNTFGVQLDEEVLAAVFAQTTEAAAVVVYIHWGKEYDLTPSPAQVSLATRLANLGADLIIGHHPHVVQTIAYIDDTLVVYSLGNYIFDQYFDDEVQTGLIVDAVLDGETRRLDVQPVTSIGSPGSPRTMTTVEAETFLGAVADRSPEAVRSDIRAGRLWW